MQAAVLEESPELPPPALDETSNDNTSPSERALDSLKGFARIAWEECRKPLSDAAGSSKVRWEIYSTWTLLLCLHHSEAEAERCRKTWQPSQWKTEEHALRHIFLQHRSVRALGAVLRWLRWSHRWTASLDNEALENRERATYERTRRAVQRRSAFPVPLQDEPAMHPDGPLQQRTRFDDDDLEEERRLLQALWVCLRRGDLRGALKLCTNRGQPWRAAMLQGMMPFADAAYESVGYENVADDDGDEDLLAKVKEEHTDWTELGALDDVSSNDANGCNGNPWRRLWKEQCWDVAQRNLKTESTMDAYELAIYGLCAGHHDALMPMCKASWADQCWGELHCLKEWLVERLLDAGRSQWCSVDALHLGEGDWGISDVTETPEDRAARAAKLSGKLHVVDVQRLESIVAQEIHTILSRLVGSVARLSPFERLQTTLIEAVWSPESGEAALEMLRSWLTHGLDGAPCPFLVKQFASYFAVWHKDNPLAVAASTECDASGTMGTNESSAPQSMELAAGSTAEEVNVDDIVCTMVQDLVTAAAGSCVQQCLEGHALELIAEHVAPLTTENRLQAYARLLLELGKRTRAQRTADDAVAAAREQVLRRSLWVFWGRFPHEAFALVTIFIRHVLRLGDAASKQTHGTVKLQADDCMGCEEAATFVEGWPRPLSDELEVALECIQQFWVVARDRAEARETVVKATSGFELLLGSPLQADLQTIDDFLRAVLEIVVIPLLTDTLLGLAVATSHVDTALSAIVRLKDSLVWRDAFSCRSQCTQTLVELDWYLDVCRLYRDGLAELNSKRKDSFATLQPQQPQSSAAHGALLESAALRLAQDTPLLEPLRGTHTLLPDGHWRSLQRAATHHVLMMLLDAFRAAGDFEGALFDLAVAVAQSPWMLSVVSAEQVRHFLDGLANIPKDARGQWDLVREEGRADSLTQSLPPAPCVA
eukprot:TRINITY_DN17638_c0_g3_i1.p1 TRINITY_DN17638_c0_g3~~TRINITY_DN17638_c0_g3_i1.p1  ORF type:complete len:940 (-),score=133.77 TRINITY_DN17638_c0_g3_i1:100-2919(-)